MGCARHFDLPKKCILFQAYDIICIFLFFIFSSFHISFFNQKSKYLKPPPHQPQICPCQPNIVCVLPGLEVILFCLAYQSSMAQFRSIMIHRLRTCTKVCPKAMYFATTLQMGGTPETRQRRPNLYCANHLSSNTFPLVNVYIPDPTAAPTSLCSCVWPGNHQINLLSIVVYYVIAVL
jgi:hypothetical protein